MACREPSDVLTALRDEWRRLGRSKEARLALVRLRATDGDAVPSGVTDLAGLVGALEPRGGLTPVERARVVAALLGSAEDALLRRCLLQTLLPGIVSVARQLGFGSGVADDARSFLAEALGEAIELLEDWAGQRRPYAAPDLLGALRCRLRRRLLAEKARRAELTQVPEREGRPDPATDLLVRELARGAVGGVTDVDLLYARCVLGLSVTELSASTGATPGVLRRRLAKAARTYVVAPS